MKILRKTIAGMLAVLLLFSNSSMIAAAANVPTSRIVSEETTPEETTEPMITSEPDATPVPTEVPEETIAPEPTVTPVPTEMPEPTITPEPAVTPEPVQPIKVGKSKNLYTTSMGKRSVELNWDKAENATYYEIYRRNSGDLSYKKLGNTSKCTWMDKKITYNKTYRYKIIPFAKRVDGKLDKGKATSVIFKNVKFVATNHKKYSYSEMVSDIKELTQKYHGLVTYKVIGKTADNRNIYDVILGNKEASKSMMVISALHAREYMTSMLSMNQIEHYLEKYNQKIAGKRVKTLLNTIAIHYIPMANPDGVTISQFGIKSIRNYSLRKKLYRMKCWNTARWKANARGVDLNRNYPYIFKKQGRRGSDGFSGNYAASESETKAIVRLSKELKKNGTLKCAVNYHAMGSIVFGGCKYRGSLRRNVNRMYNLARKITGYRSAASYGGKGYGNLREYQMYTLRIPSITLELGHTSCPLPLYEFRSIWNRNKELIFREAMLFL